MVENNYSLNSFKENQEKLKKVKNRKLILMLVILGVIFITFGVTYAIFETTKVGKNNSVLLAGDIYMHYKENNVLNLTDATPRETYDSNSYFEFTIDGKNEYKKPIWYDISLVYGDNVEGKKTRISDYLLKFRLVENRSGEEKVLFDNKSYNDINNKRIWVDKIDKDTGEEIKITYKLYMWLSSELEVGNTSTATYTPDVWNNDLYASVKVNVSGDFEEKTLNEEEERAVDVIKKKVNQNGQVIAIDNNSNKCQDITNCNVREYRYSGTVANNYVKLHNNNQDELWRIIGVFKEGNEEYVKLVRNDELSKEILPNEYVIDGTTYKIKTTEDGDFAYWNNVTGSNATNDWSKSGLQYYLNTEQDSKGTKGYLSYLSTETMNMIREDTKYYLGALNMKEGGDTTIKAYQHERAVEGCLNNLGPEENNTKTAIEENSSCRVWKDYPAIWTGKVSMLYVSDYGFSLNSNHWTKEFYSLSVSNSESWMLKTMTGAMKNNIWSFPPSISNQGSAIGIGSAYDGYAHEGPVTYDRNVVLPVIALKPNVKITNGNGLENNPYILELGD